MLTTWPIFKQITDFFAVIMLFVFSICESLNLRHAGFYIIFFAVIANIILLPLEFIKGRNNKVAAWANEEIQRNGKRYSKNAYVAYKPKIALERFIIEKKYNYSSSFSLKMFGIQLPILIILYNIIGNLEKYIPALSNLSETELSSLYTIFGHNIKDTPGFTIMAIFPIIATLVPTIGNIVTAKLNKKKITVSVLTSNLLTLILAFRFSTYLSIYWATNSLLSIISSTIVFFVYKNKTKEYLQNKVLKKMNKSRVKRGLPELKELIMFPEAIKKEEIPKAKEAAVDGC